MEADSLRSGTTFDALERSTSSDDEVLDATAEARAAAGSYSFTVDALAQPEILASQGYASLDAAVGSGTFSITVGSGAAKVITVGSADATLAGLRDAINESGADVTASIVNTGSGSQPYKLVLTSKKSGAANTITIDANLSGGSSPPLRRGDLHGHEGRWFRRHGHVRERRPCRDGNFRGDDDALFGRDLHGRGDAHLHVRRGERRHDRNRSDRVHLERWRRRLRDDPRSGDVRAGHGDRRPRRAHGELRGRHGFGGG